MREINMSEAMQNMFYASIFIGFISIIVMFYIMRAILNIPKFLSYQKAQTKLLMMIVEQNNKNDIDDNHKKILNDIIIQCELKDIKLYEIKNKPLEEQKKQNQNTYKKFPYLKNMGIFMYKKKELLH